MDADEGDQYARALNHCRPCLHASCRHNLYLDVRGSGPTAGEAIIHNFPDLEPDQVPADRSCALDIADMGGATLGDVAKLTNLTRERIRQIQEKALAKIKLRAAAAGGKGIDQFVDDLDVDKVPNKISGAQRLFRDDDDEKPSSPTNDNHEDEHDHDLTLGDGDTLSFFSEHPKAEEIVSSRVWRIYMRESVAKGFARRKLTKRQLSGEVAVSPDTDADNSLRVRHNDGMAHSKTKTIDHNLTDRQQHVVAAYNDLGEKLGRVPNNVEIAKATDLDVTAVTRDRQVLIKHKLAKPSPRGKIPGEKKNAATPKKKARGKAKKSKTYSLTETVAVEVARKKSTVVSIVQGPADSIVTAIRQTLENLDTERARLVQALAALGG